VVNATYDNVFELRRGYFLKIINWA
jgi:hypothetical protein